MKFIADDDLRDERLLIIQTDMNYVSAVYGVVVIIIVVDWLVRGRRAYRGQTLRHEEAEARLAGADVVR